MVNGHHYSCLGLEKHNLSNFLLQYEKVVLMNDPA